MKYSILIVLALMIAVNAYGQNRITALHYDISLPDGYAKTYIDNTSWRGIGFDGRWFLNPDVAATLGISLGWHVFNEKTSGTITSENAALTGVQYRYINSFPLMVTGHYYFGDKDRLWAFIGAGVGTYYVIQRFEVGVFAFEASNWHFGFYPEVGVQLPLREADLFVSTRYNFALSSGESLSGDSQDYEYWGISLGLAYHGW